MAFGHNELWRLKTAKVATKLAKISPIGNTGLATAVSPAPPFGGRARSSAAADALGSGSHIAHGEETTSQTLPVWDDDKETMGRKIYNTSIPYGILIMVPRHISLTV